MEIFRKQNCIEFEDENSNIKIKIKCDDFEGVVTYFRYQPLSSHQLEDWNLEAEVKFNKKIDFEKTFETNFGKILLSGFGIIDDNLWRIRAVGTEALKYCFWEDLNKDKVEGEV